MKKRIIMFFVVALVLVFSLMFIFINKGDDFVDSIIYNDKTYTLLEFDGDIFTYNYNYNDYLEEDVIHMVSHERWDIIYFNGDLFILDTQCNDAIEYYSDDNNYEWYVVLGEEEMRRNILISSRELEFLSNIENIEKKDTLSFDDIENFADLLKVSKDGLVQGVTLLAFANGDWYYKTEVMTDDDREYVIKIIDSLNKKIKFIYGS